MSRRECGKGYVVIDGPRFDFDRVLDAAEHVLDAFADRIGGGMATVSGNSPPFTKRISWPDPGREIARKVWRDITGVCDVVDEALVHAMGDVSLKAFLLGKTWLVQAPDGAITMPDLISPADRIDPTPMICVYGTQSAEDPRSFAVATVQRMRELRMIAKVAVRVPHEFAVVGVGDDGRGAPTHAAGFIRFQHEFYGAGRGDIRVRCVTPEGAPIRPDRRSN